MLHYFVKNPELGEFQRTSTPQYKDVWIHAPRSTEEDIEKLGSEVGLNTNILHDITDRNELPRVEYDGSDLYVFTRFPTKDAHGHVNTSPLLSIVTKDAFITLSNDQGMEPSELVQVKLKAKQDQQTNLLINSLAHVVLTYENLIQETGHSVKEIGKKIRTHEVRNHDFVRFVTIEDNLNEYQMNLDGLHTITKRLGENTHSSFHYSDTEALADLTLHIEELCSAISSYSKMIVSFRNTYSTIANNTLNQRMKLLTLITVLLAVPNVFYSMYGMNIVIPFQHEPWAYFAINGAAVIVVIVLLFVVKKFKVF
jgi:magnesium transporter